MKNAKLTVTRSNDALPHRPQLSPQSMLELRPARQPFRGTETSDQGMPVGTDTRTPGWFQGKGE